MSSIHVEQLLSVAPDDNLFDKSDLLMEALLDLEASDPSIRDASVGSDRAMSASLSTEYRLRLWNPRS